MAEHTIGLIADTHFASPRHGRELVEWLLANPFNGVDAVLHAGDMLHPGVEHLFAPVPFYAVRGNCDVDCVETPMWRTVTMFGKRIGLIHGWGSGNDLPSRVMERFADKDVDCIVYGHSHYPYCEQHGDVLLVNPGSAGDRRSAPWHSVALLHVGEQLRAEIVNIDDMRRNK